MNQVLPDACFITHGRRDSGRISLTFDDGPDPEYTPRLLDRLDDLGVLATFFVVGERAERHPGIIERMIAEGHAVGSHTWSHADPAVVGTRAFRRELVRTNALLHSLTGSDVKWCRPPKGRVSVGKLAACWSLGMGVALWNVDPRDYTATSAEQLWKRLSAHCWRGGDIVLLHDNQPHADSVLERLVMQFRQLHLKPIRFPGSCSLPVPMERRSS